MNKLVFSIITISMIAVLGLSLSSAFGFGFGMGKSPLGNLGDADRALLDEKRNATLTAIENNDYSAWKELMNSEITQEKFNQIVIQHEKMSQVRELREELRTATESGDSSKVLELKTQLSDLGFENGFAGKGNGKGKGMHNGQNKMSNADCPFAN